MLKFWIWFSELRGLQNQTRLALLHHFGSPEAVFYADREELLLTDGMTPEQLSEKLGVPVVFSETDGVSFIKSVLEG